MSVAMCFKLHTHYIVMFVGFQFNCHHFDLYLCVRDVHVFLRSRLCDPF